MAAPQIVIEPGVALGSDGAVIGEELVAIGELTQFGPDLDLRCRRAYIGKGIWAGRSIRIGGGGHRDPWATLDENPNSLEPLLEIVARDQAAGLPDAPWPPVYPKQPNEPPRVAPSRARKA